MTPRLDHWTLSLVVAAVLLCGAAAVGAAEAGKVDPWVLRSLAEANEVEFLVVLGEQADVSAARWFPTKIDRGRFVFERLTATAARTQAPVLAALRARGLGHRAYWVANMIWVRGDAAAVAALAARSDVKRVAGNPRVSFEPLAVADAEGANAAPEGNLIQVGAPDFWAQGITGQGAVIAGADTGYAWAHPALRDQYRGWNGSTATHDYNWHDAIHSGGGSCGANAAAPCDDNGHGTRTLGLMVGDDGAGNQIGMAPGARWIGCRNMDQGNGTPTTYSECLQFFLAPTDGNDQNPLPELAPDVVNGSWSCPPAEGCSDPNILKTVVENLRAAGIVVAQAATNDGPNCGSIDRPAAIYDAAFTVGAVNGSDDIVNSSSRGPVTIDGSNRLKPDVTAPGQLVRTSDMGGGYALASGTSMAAPHVSGLVALLVSAQECFRGEPDDLEDYMTQTALPRTTTQECGGVPGDQVPNNTYGFGSLRAVLPMPTACRSIFSDGFESGDTSAWSAAVP